MSDRTKIAMHCDFYLLFVNQCSEMIFCKDVAGHLLQVLGGEAVDVAHDVAEVALLSAVQVVLGEVEGKLLATVAGNGQLALQLLLGLAQLGGGEWMLYEFGEFASHQSAATLHVVWVATEIHAPAARVAIAHHTALYAIHQSVALSERQVQARVETRPAQDVVEQVESPTAFVVGSIGTRADDDVGLMGAAFEFRLLLLVLDYLNHLHVTIVACKILY